MAEPPRLYLITPPVIALAEFPDTLAAVLDTVPVACLRLALGTRSEDEILRAGDALREVCHPRDVALVVSDHFRLVGRIGIDGVHLTDGARQVRAARKELGSDAIVGACCRASRHDGINAAEIGADYVSFGPVSSSSLGDGTVAPEDLFAWWSEMIEVPVVAEGGLTLDLASSLAATVDFVAFGDEVWNHPDGAAAALQAFAVRLG